MAKSNWPKSLALSRWFNTYIEKHSDYKYIIQNQKIPLDQLNLSKRFNFYRDQFSVEKSLRRLRQDHFALCMIRDLDFKASMFEITSAMTNFAEFAINIAYQTAKAEISERFGQAKLSDGCNSELHIVGMGKLGGGELNVSSDIDLVFLYPEDTDQSTSDMQISFPEYFIRITKRIIAILDDVSEDGRVFRVDTRLRPHGGSGPLACSFNFFENYLYQDGRDWERYAWIKGRLIIGNLKDELAKIIRPFVFRKYLDYSAVTAMANLHSQIRQQVERKDVKNDIKLGRGGIREIEFIAQVLQLMRGGRRPELQIKPTIKILDVLAKNGFLKQQEVEKLKEYYIFLRRLEHRLQYREDAQTQMLPTNPEILQKVADSLDMSVKEFNNYFKRLQNNISKIFDQLFIQSPNLHTDSIDKKNNEAKDFWNYINKISANGSNFELINNLSNEFDLQGFLLKNGINKDIIEAFINHAKTLIIKSLKTETQNDHFQLISSLINFCKTEKQEVHQQKALNEDLIYRFLDLLTVLARRPSYLKLLTQSTSSLQRLFRFLQASSWGAQYLKTHPILLDDLLDNRLLEEEYSVKEFQTQLKQGIRKNMDTGERMNWLREIHHANVFRLLIQDLEGKITLEKLADHLSEIADVIIDSALIQCWLLHKAKISKVKIDKPKIAVISYGKLGGKELGYSSDLDLVLIHDDKNNDHLLTYHKTALSLTHWLSSNTEAGVLFDTDYRLRPDGNAGVLVPSLEGYAKYQKTKAWVWEHQALTRARFSAGDKEIGERFEKLRQEILSLPRDVESLRTEISQMRQKIAKNHLNRSNQFDIKHDCGGLVDIEFIVQFLVLAYSANHHQLTANIGNIGLLKKTGELNLIPKELANNCADSYREYRRVQHQCRLNGQKYSRIEKSQFKRNQNEVMELWKLVFKDGK